MEEVEQICSRIMIMDGGRVLAQGTNDDLKRMVAVGERIVVETAQVSRAVFDRLRALSHVLEVSFDAGMLTICCEPSEHNLTDVLGVLGRGLAFGWDAYTPSRPPLNDVFLELTGRELRD